MLTVNSYFYGELKALPFLSVAHSASNQKDLCYVHQRQGQ